MCKRDIEMTIDRWYADGLITLADYDLRQAAIEEGRGADALTASEHIELASA